MSQFFDPVVKMIVGLAAQQIQDANDKGGKNMVSVGTDHHVFFLPRTTNRSVLENRKSYSSEGSENRSTYAKN